MNDFLMLDVCDREFFRDYLFNKIKDSLDISSELQRVYFNLQWPGRHGKLHKDGCDLTALLFVSPWDPDWGGFTQIMLPSNQITVIPPIQNRLICFPGNFPHKGYAFSGNAPKRISLAFKMINVKNRNQSC